MTVAATGQLHRFQTNASLRAFLKGVTTAVVGMTLFGSIEKMVAETYAMPHPSFYRQLWCTEDYALASHHVWHPINNLFPCPGKVPTQGFNILSVPIPVYTLQ